MEGWRICCQSLLFLQQISNYFSVFLWSVSVLIIRIHQIFFPLELHNVLIPCCFAATLLLQDQYWFIAAAFFYISSAKKITELTTDSPHTPPESSHNNMFNVFGLHFISGYTILIFNATPWSFVSSVDRSSWSLVSGYTTVSCDQFKSISHNTNKLRKNYMRQQQKELRRTIALLNTLSATKPGKWKLNHLLFIKHDEASGGRRKRTDKFHQGRSFMLSSLYTLAFSMDFMASSKDFWVQNKIKVEINNSVSRQKFVTINY